MRWVFDVQLTAEEAEMMRSQIVTASGPRMRSQSATGDLRSQTVSMVPRHRGGIYVMPEDAS